MKRILWLAAVATLLLAVTGVTAKTGIMPIGNEKLHASVDGR